MTRKPSRRPVGLFVGATNTQPTIVGFYLYLVSTVQSRLLFIIRVLCHTVLFVVNVCCYVKQCAARQGSLYTY